MRRLILALATILGLAACDEGPDDIVIGAKNFGENRVLAHMMAELLIQNGIPVAGVVDYPDTQTLMEAFQSGDVDAYSEYNGTALVMLGQNPTTDGDRATELVRQLYEPLGYSWRERFGFANNYALAMRPAVAERLGIETMSDLEEAAPELTIGVEDDFQTRPLDGLQAMNARYDLAWQDVRSVGLDNRARLYEMLLDGEADVIEVYTTDGQLADFGLTVLEDDRDFFPVYQAASVARTASLAAWPQMGAVLDSLAGQIDVELMQELNRRVDIEGREPQAVARAALAELGLIEGGAIIPEEPVTLAMAPALSDGSASLRAVRAARAAFSGNEIVVLADESPLAQVADGSARIALVSAEAFFDLSTAAPQRIEAFEALGVIGRNLVHLIAAEDGPRALSRAQRLITGPEGSSSHKVATIVKSGLGLDAQIVPLDTADVDALAAETGSDGVAVVMSPEGGRQLQNLFSRGGHRLLPLPGWTEGANLVRYPFLRPDSIAAGSYDGQSDAVESLGAQLVLAGPARNEDMAALGDSGPLVIQDELQPLSPPAVRAINAALGDAVVRVDPTLRQAPALRPELPEPPAPINPSADISILSLLVTLLFVWLIWLYIRPEYR